MPVQAICTILVRDIEIYIFEAGSQPAQASAKLHEGGDHYHT